MTSGLSDELCRLSREATPGVWKRGHSVHHQGYNLYAADTDGDITHPGAALSRQDADLIVGMHEALPDLLEALAILLDLVASSDDGADTYEVRGIVERAAALLGLPGRTERRRPPLTTRIANRRPPVHWRYPPFSDAPADWWMKHVQHWNRTGKCLTHFSIDNPPHFCEQCGKPWSQVLDGRIGRKRRRERQRMAKTAP